MSQRRVSQRTSSSYSDKWTRPNSGKAFVERGILCPCSLAAHMVCCAKLVPVKKVKIVQTHSRHKCALNDAIMVCFSLSTVRQRTMAQATLCIFATWRPWHSRPTVSCLAMWTSVALVLATCPATLILVVLLERAESPEKPPADVQIFPQWHGHLKWIYCKPTGDSGEACSIWSLPPR